MKQTIKEAVYVLFHICVLAYATVLLVGGITNIVHAQEPRNYRIENIEQRISDIEGLKLGERLVRIETLLADIEAQQSHTWVNDAAGGGVGLLLARAVYLEIKRRKE